MKAVSFNEHGGPEVLSVIDTVLPVLKSTEVMIKVKVAGLNPGEIAIREGYMEGLFPTDFPCGEGTDFAGIVIAVGSEVAPFKPGDEVVGYTLNRGSHAEYIAVSQDNLVVKPDTVSWEVGGSLFVSGITGHAAVEAVDVKAGDTVAISGAAGSVGLIAAQLALHRGAKVIGIVDKWQTEWLTSHGIIPIDYHDDVASEIVKQVHKIDSFIDTVGDGYVELAVNLGVSHNKINTCIDFAAADKYKVKSDGSATGNAKILQELIGLIANGKLDVPISKVYSLNQVQEAYTYLASKHVVGKVVFSIS